MEPAEAYYTCAACGRSYKSTTTSDKCAVCGAAARAPQPDRNTDALTDKFRLAVSRAKGNF